MRQVLKDNAILDAAEYVFGWKGYQQTTMEMLSNKTGISVGTLYNRFKSKEGLYAQVARRIGESVVSRIQPLLEAKDPREAVLDIIRLRLYNNAHDRLFFQPFALPTYLGVQPLAESLGPEVNRLHEEYVKLVERIFARALEKNGQSEPCGMTMAVCLEGMIIAFMNYLSGPLQPDNMAAVARQMRSVLLGGGASAMEQPEDSAAAETRAVYISRSDMDRLGELLGVVRAVGKPEWREYADALDEALKHARITNPREVPPDVVTLNSRVGVANLNVGSDRVYALVFPRDVGTTTDSVSILTPFGTALLGRRLGDVFVLGAGQDAAMYQVTQMLYQPEAAGEYHLLSL